ncbi:MAG TPA: PQQ-binding-like beta-propeller repeat protein [Flavobacteriaceae bacterium]|nr:PQQ-binding-like beta-propeller repeat protein [Flavobacteriaceae bacterium]
MKIPKINFLICLSLLWTTNVLCQKAEIPTYHFNVDASINSMTLTQGGTLVVPTNNGLLGIKAGSNEPLFNFTDYGGVKTEELFFVPNAPYVIIDQSGFAAISSKKAVIDYMSGKKLFSTEDNGWKNVTICDVVVPENKLVVSGQRRANEKYAIAVAVYDLKDGKQEHFVTLKAGEIVTGQPLLVGNGLIVPTTRFIKKINLGSGQVEWETKVDNIKWMVADESGKEIYGFEIRGNGDTRVYKIGSNGVLLWEDPVKLKGNVVQFKILPEGLAIVSNEDNSGKGGLGKLAAGGSQSNISFLNASNGEDLWEKAPKTKGFVQHFYMMEDGILFGIQEGGINKVSFNGKPLFKKPLKTGENILTMAETPHGLIYITSEDANIVNLKTGNQVWEKPLKYKRADAVCSTFDEKNGRYLIAAGEVLYAIDANSGEHSVLAEVEFDGKESPSEIEIRENGILLSSDQNMMMLDWNGKEIWHEYYRAPGKSAAGAILMGVLAVATASQAASAGYTAGTLKPYSSTRERYEDYADGMSKAASQSIQEMLKRFKATSATKNAQFILTKLDEGVALVKLNKESGEVEKQIILNDKKPNYEVDEIAGILYYQAGNEKVYAYKL